MRASSADAAAGAVGAAGTGAVACFFEDLAESAPAWAERIRAPSTAAAQNDRDGRITVLFNARTKARMIGYFDLS